MGFQKKIEEYEDKIRRLKKEAALSGRFHRRDVNKRIKRMSAELAEYKRNIHAYQESQKRRGGDQNAEN